MIFNFFPYLVSTRREKKQEVYDAIHVDRQGRENKSGSIRNQLLKSLVDDNDERRRYRSKASYCSGKEDRKERDLLSGNYKRSQSQ